MDWLGVRKLPFLTRHSFVAEFRHLSAWSFVAGLVEGQFAGVVAAKSFNASELLIAIASATPMVANLSSLAWGLLCTGRPKIPLLVFCAIGVATSIAAVGLIPPGTPGALPFVIVMAVAQVMLVGVVTIRTAIWKANYPVSLRGQITARLQRLRMMISVIAVLVAAEISDWDPTAYRILFPAGAALGVIGIFFARRIRIRREKTEVNRWTHHGPTSASDQSAIDANRWVRPAVLGLFKQMYRVLTSDRRFAVYCIAQFLLGFGNLMTIAVVISLITRDLPLDDDSGYWVGTALVVAIPNLLVMISVTRWGALFDRVGVLRMRMWNVACWLASLIFGCFACLVIVYRDRIGTSFLPIAVVLLGFRAIGYGLGMGGGALAWNLGHLHFAKPEQAEIYMGIHVTLTGVRGLTAPLLGIWLWNTIGWPVWIVAIVLTLLSEIAFGSLARLEAREKKSPGKT